VKVTNQQWFDKMLDGMKNSSGAAKALDALDKGFTILGVGFDTWSNMEMGDAWYYGLGKASGSGALMGHLCGKNPALAVMELANFLSFGGSKAGDIISPVKNISGSFNFISDKFVDTANGTDIAGGRLKGGKYGATLQNADEASEVAAE
jgi:hypothetical protein